MHTFTLVMHYMWLYIQVYSWYSLGGQNFVWHDYLD